jgi:agmatinase
VGARALDPGESAFLAETGIDDDVGRALAAADAVYVALDVDVLDPAAAPVFMPEAGGMSVEAVERMLAELQAALPLAGMGLTGHVPRTDTALLARLAAAAGLPAVAAARD